MGLEKDYHLYVKMHDLHFNDNTVTKVRFKCCAVLLLRVLEKLLFAFVSFFDFCCNRY